MKKFNRLKFSALTLAAILGFGTLSLGVSGFELPVPASDAAVAPPNLYRSTEQFPFSSIHNFGIAVFGNATFDRLPGTTGHPGLGHMEGGIIVARDLNLFSGYYVDFGQAHVPPNIQFPHHPQRLIVGGDINSNLHPNHPDHIPSYHILLYGGDILISDFTNIHLYAPISAQHSPVTPVHGGGAMVCTVCNLVTDSPTCGHGWGNLEWQNFHGNFDTVPRLNDAHMNWFLTSLHNSMINLRDGFAGTAPLWPEQTVSIYRHPNVISSGQVPPLPPHAYNYHYIIYDLEVINGVIGRPTIDFYNDFEGIFVFNIPNHQDSVTFAGDTIFTPESNEAKHGRLLDIHEMGQEFGRRIIWNFTGSGSIYQAHNSGGFTTIGSILAPTSDMLAPYGGAVKGYLIVYNFYHFGRGFEQHSTYTPPYFRPLPERPTEPTTPELTTTTPAATTPDTTTTIVAPTTTPFETTPVITTPTVTTPTETTTPSEVTTPIETTTPNETTAPGEVTTPAEVTTPTETTTPVETTTPSEVTTPAEITTPDDTTTPVEVTTPDETTAPETTPTEPTSPETTTTGIVPPTTTPFVPTTPQPTTPQPTTPAVTPPVVIEPPIFPTTTPAPTVAPEFPVVAPTTTPAPTTAPLTTAPEITTPEATTPEEATMIEAVTEPYTEPEPEVADYYFDYDYLVEYDGYIDLGDGDVPLGEGYGDGYGDSVVRPESNFLEARENPVTGGPLEQFRAVLIALVIMFAMLITVLVVQMRKRSAVRATARTNTQPNNQQKKE